jgi:hypothetical protein
VPLSIFGLVTLPVWVVFLVGIMSLLCLLLAWHAIDALQKATRTYDLGEHIEALEGIAEKSQKWLELADRTNAIKAAVFGIAGVVLGAIGGLSADWVAHGTWKAGTTGRAFGIGLAILAVSAVVFLVIYKWTPSDPAEARPAKAPRS